MTDVLLPRFPKRSAWTARVSRPSAFPPASDPARQWAKRHRCSILLRQTEVLCRQLEEFRCINMHHTLWSIVIHYQWYDLDNVFPLDTIGALSIEIYWNLSISYLSIPLPIAIPSQSAKAPGCFGVQLHIFRGILLASPKHCNFMQMKELKEHLMIHLMDI